MKLKSILLTICWLIIIISSYSQNESNYMLTTLLGPLMALPFGSDSQHELPLYKDSPVIYDNDDHRITTYSPHEYQEFVKGREMIMDLATASGLQNLPELFSGTNRKLVRPENNRIEDTKPLDIDGSHFIVKIAGKCSFSKPLVIITGGQLTSVANAYLLDPSIAEKIVFMGIFGAEAIDYNAGLDAWAWTIILAKFRVAAIPIGPPGNRGVVYMKPPEVPKERILNELDQNIPFFKWMYEKDHPTNWLPAESDYDGHPAILITRPDYVTQWTRYRFDGINENGRPILIEDITGTIMQAENAVQDIATDEFWRVMHALGEQIDNY